MNEIQSKQKFLNVLNADLTYQTALDMFGNFSQWMSFDKFWMTVKTIYIVDQDAFIPSEVMLTFRKDERGAFSVYVVD